MSWNDVKCFLCHTESVQQTEVSLENLLTAREFPNGKLFTIKSGNQLAIGSKHLPLIELVRRKSLAEFPEGVGWTYWNGTEILTLPAFGDRIGQTIIVCAKCCDAHAQDLENLLHKEYERRLAQRYAEMCRRLFESELLKLDADAFEKFIDEHGDSVLGDEWVATLLELQGIAAQPNVAYIKTVIQPLVNAFSASRAKNGARLVRVK